MNKTITVLLLIFLLLLGVCGCANNTPKASDPSYEETTAEIDPTALPRTVATEAAPSEDDTIKLDWHEIDHVEHHFLGYYTLDERHVEEIYDASELTGDIIVGRDGKLIAERCIGVVTDAQSGSGRVLNPYDKEYDYISYSFCDVPYKDGTVIVTYLIYDPYTDGVDDIIDRFDIVLTREYET